jgi:hypothetical protein
LPDRPPGTESAIPSGIGTVEVNDMIELDERIENEKEQSKLLKKQMECECPDTSCPVAHES